MTQDNPTPRIIICPYCGHLQPVSEQCTECGGLFEPLSRQATQIAMGPWFIRDRNIPFRPGCSYEVLKKQIQAGRIKPTTVMRGPTTHQFWSVARNVPGVAHLLGFCYVCNSVVDPKSESCPECHANFNLPTSRNKLGLQYPNQIDADNAQMALDREIEKKFGPSTKTTVSNTTKAAGGASGAPSSARPVAAGGLDLLDQVLGGPTSLPQSGIKPSATQASPKPMAASAPSANKPAALDFTPTPESSGRPRDTSPTGPINQASANSSNRALVWILVASNIIVVGLLALAVWYFKNAS